MVTSRILAIALAFAVVLPADAGVLYKSVGKDGSVTFSDLPPSSESRLLETRILSGSTSSGGIPAPLQRGPAIAMAEAERLLVSDEALARANAQVDEAEHALALARRDTWSPRDGLRIAPTRLTPADEQRIRVHRNAVLAARQALMDLLRERRVAAIANPPEPGSPYVVSYVARR